MSATRVGRWLKLLAFIAVAGGAVFGTYRWRTVQAASEVPTAPARKGEFLVISRCRGQLRASKSVQITAPVNVPDLRIVWQAPPSTQVKIGDVVLRFDQSSAKQQLEEKEAALRQAQATLEQAVAEARITAEQDKLDLSSARYEVERAKLEVSKLEIVSALKGEESKIDLGLAEKKLRVQEAAVTLHEASSKAKIASLTRLLDQAQYEVDLTKKRLAQMEIKAPQPGLILFLPNYSQGWMNAKPFQVGDQVWPGAAVAEIPDLSTIEMEGKIEEIERGRVSAGADVRVRIDSLPEMNGTLDIVVNRLQNAISVPAKAVFTKSGKPVVYLASGKRYNVQPVAVIARNPDEVAVGGIAPGASVTLVEVEGKAQAK